MEPTQSAVSGSEAMQSMIAADLATPDSAPLQGASDSGSDATSSAVDAQPQPSESVAATQQVQSDGADSGQPADTQQPQEDEFNIDLDKDPTEGQADASPTADAQAGDEAMDPDDVVGQYLATPRGKRIYSDYKAMREVAKPSDEGGIGFKPSVEQIVDYFKTYTGVRAMEADFHSGDPQAIEQWADYWFGPNGDGQTRPGAVEAAAQLPEVLLKAGNRDAYIKMSDPILNRYGNAAIGRLMEVVSNSKDQAEQQRYYDAAQLLHYDLFGKWFDPQRFGQQAQQQQHFSAEKAELQRLQQQIRQEQQAAQSFQVNSFVNRLDTTLERTLTADIDQALAAVKGKVPDVVYRGIKADFTSAVKADLDRNRDGLRLLDIAKKEAMRSLADSEIPKLVKQYRQMYVNSIMAKRSEYITAAGQTFKAQSDQRHSQLQQSASKTGPTTNGQPVQQNLAPAFLQKQPGESQSDFMLRLIKSAG